MRDILVRGIIISELLFVILSLFFAVLPRSSAVANLQRDYSNNEEYCETGKNAKKHQKTKDCQTFIYRSLDDPTALYTFFLVAVTGALFIVTGGLFYAAIEQGRSAERLFIIDQRPRVEARINCIGYGYTVNGSLQINALLTVRNTGKGIAIGLRIGGIFSRVGDPVAARENFDTVRFVTSRQAKTLSETIFANDSVTTEHVIVITAEQLRTLWITADTTEVVLVYAFATVAYRGSMSDEYFETSIFGNVNMTGPLGPFPRDQEEATLFRANPTFLVLGFLSHIT